MSDAGINIAGLDELQDTLDSLIKKYPDKAGELLKKEARQFRKDVVKETKKDTDRGGYHPKYDLYKVGAYKLSRIYGIGRNQAIDISAKAPHFHLVEHGHQMVVPGTMRIKNSNGKWATIKNPKAGMVTGRVEGKHMMQHTIEEYRIKAPQYAQKMIDELLKEEGLS